MAKEDDGHILHSAEHMFARSLQNLGVDVKVIKADTFRADGKGFLLLRGKIPMIRLFEAEINVNSVIPKDLKTTMETFEDIASATKRYPNLRFNEDRLKETKNIRLVKIGDFDVCACKNKHVDNTSEIRVFVVVGASYLGGDTEIEFKAGHDAVDYLLSNNNDIVELGHQNNFNAKEIKKDYNKLLKDIGQADRDLEKTFMLLLKNSASKFLEVEDLSLSRFYKTVNDFVRINPGRYIILMSKSQLIAVKGASNGSDLRRIGDRLRERKVFVGDVRDDYINGKILDYEETKMVFSELSSLLT